MNSPIYDVIIIGSGPAGLTAAIYASRDNLKTLVIGGRKWGGQLMLTTTVDNFPGFPKGIEGPDLMSNMKAQAERFSAEVKLVDAVEVNFKNKPFQVWTDETSEPSVSTTHYPLPTTNSYSARAVIIATGADTLWLGLPNEQKLIGHGVSSCAPCDAFFFKNKKVIVVGGGDAAMEEAYVLAKFCTEVTIVHRRDSFRASKIMQDRVLSLPNVKVMYNTQVTDILGAEKVEGVVLKSTTDSELPTTNFVCDGVFVAIGHAPNTKLFEGQLELDEKGYIKKLPTTHYPLPTTNSYQMATSVPGVFVAGDVHDHHFRQAITAAAFGCMAAMDVSDYLASLE